MEFTKAPLIRNDMVLVIDLHGLRAFNIARLLDHGDRYTIISGWENVIYTVDVSRQTSAPKISRYLGHRRR